MRKQIYSTFAISGVLLLLSIFNSCVQEETFAKATVETSVVTSITEATATCGGIITADGGSDVTTRGVCWSTLPTPTIENDTTIVASGTSAFTSSIKGLSPSTTYYVRAYAVNKGGVAYGLNMIFTTKTISITTTPISFILLTATSAIGGGNIISDGDSSFLTVKARGVCWNTFPSPTVENSKTTDGVGGGRFTSKIDSLTPFTTYYVRAYATNGNGTIYGNEVSFTTLNGVIGITTNAVSSIMAYTANCGGTITSDGGSTVTERGLCWNTSPSPTTANNKTVNIIGTDSYTANITGLTPGTAYYIRTYAINKIGTSYGNEISFNTQSGVIELITNTVSSITTCSATTGGTIATDGGATVTERGVCWSTSENPTTADKKTSNGSTSGTFTSSIGELTANTKYYVRSWATNSVGTAYGNQVSFTTLASSGTVTDIEGNIYNFITIGTQVWMVENLRTSKYNDGTSIPNITDGTTWLNLTTPGYCFYNNDAANKTTYGALYNWYTVNTGRLAPTGWHVPTTAEWVVLEDYLAANLGTSGSVAKTLASTTDWASSSNAGAIGNDLTKNNNSGFSGLPGGSRGGTFNGIGVYAYWWNSRSDHVSCNFLDYSSSSLSYGLTSERVGFSVRCLRDY